MATTREQSSPALTPDDALRIFEVADTGLLLLDSDLGVLRMNQRAAQFLRADQDASVGADARSLFGTAWPHVEWLFAVALRTGEGRKTAFSLRSQPDAWQYLSASVTILEHEESSPNLLMSLADITQHYQGILKTAQTDKMAAVGLLAAGIAHEFNNIWASIQGYAELSKQNPAFATELVDVVIEQSERTSEIIHALLSFSDLRVDFQQNVHLAAILRSILRLVDLELRAKGIEAHLTTSDDPPIVGNPSMLQQVFLNLVINACHAIEGTGHIEVTLASEAGEALVRVTDSGTGIANDRIDRVFEPFYTTKGALGGNEHVDGHGLGLTLSYNVIRMHGGSIDVESGPEGGTTFTVRIPMDSASQAPSPTTSAGFGVVASEDALQDVPAGTRILLVEDEILFHDLVRQLLPQCQVDTVADGHDALKYLEADPYDVVLLDLILTPEMSGFQVFDTIIERGLTCQVVLLTGRPGDDRLPLYEDRAAGMVLKPFSLPELRGALAKALAPAAE